jgi:nucleotide-binding universal stress UspA family protein
MRLLCATDLSSRADRAIRRAGRLTRDFQAELVLLSVVDDDQPARLIESGRREVGALLAELSGAMHELQGLSPRLRVEVGDAFDTIINVAEAECADLVVMGEHRKRLLRDVVVGTTIERVMRLGQRPVLMVNAPSERPYQRVLATLDMSEPSAHALRTANRLGLLRRAELIIFHSFEPVPGRGSLMLADASHEAIQDHMRQATAERRAELTDFLRQQDLVAGSALPRMVLEEGPPASALRRAVAQLLPDLVVLGTRGHGALGRLVLGSFAEETLRSLDCDVLAVPPAAP